MSTVSDRLTDALADRYRIERELGRGGMATVYLARDLKHERDVALKVLKPELGAVLGGERFLNEIRTTANLQHPNLLPLFDSGTADGLLYYVMPYIEGETLRTRLDNERQLPVDETIRLVALMASALDFAHARGVVHRDLKPENILLQVGQPIVADFGIALAVAEAGGERITETGLSLGTPHYMSPEQAAGTFTVDARADQYALGAMAYEMLVGEPPHTGATTAIIVARLMTETPRSIRGTRSAVSPGVESAVMRALEKSPADRFASCGAFADALAAGARDAVTTASSAATSAPISANATTPNNTTAPRASAGRRVATVGAVLTLVAVVVTATVMYSRGASDNVNTDGDTTERSLAVLPFTSVGGDTANSYFAAGIADELTNALTQIPGLRLAGRASAARVKEQGSGTREIGEALNVAAVLDGSVRRAGDRIRVSAELTSTTDGRVLWGQTYERALADVFAVQDDITREIVAALQVRLSTDGSAGSGSARGGTKDLQAYDLYLRAQQHYRDRDDGLFAAERYLMEAVARDPGYARAQALLASVLLVQPYYVSVSASAVRPRALAAAKRAVALDDSLAEGHVAMGHAHEEASEWTEAALEFERAIALDPQSAYAHYRLGELYFRMGRVREALPQLETANRLDPSYSQNSAYVIMVLALIGRTDDAIVVARKALAQDPQHISVNTWYARALDLAGRHTEAAAQAHKVLTLTDRPERVGDMGIILANSGANDEAQSVRRLIEQLPPETEGRDVALIFTHLAVGDLAGAMNALEVAVKTDPTRLAAYGLISRNYDPLRADPRFAAVLRTLQLDVARLTLPDGGRSR